MARCPCGIELSQEEGNGKKKEKKEGKIGLKSCLLVIGWENQRLTHFPLERETKINYDQLARRMTRLKLDHSKGIANCKSMSVDILCTIWLCNLE